MHCSVGWHGGAGGQLFIDPKGGPLEKVMPAGEKVACRLQPGVQHPADPRHPEPGKRHPCAMARSRAFGKLK